MSGVANGQDCKQLGANLLSFLANRYWIKDTKAGDIFYRQEEFGGAEVSRPLWVVSFCWWTLRKINYSLYLQFVSICRKSHSAYNRMLYTLLVFSIICLVLIFQTSAVHNHPFFVLLLIQSLVYFFWVLQK